MEDTHPVKDSMNEEKPTETLSNPGEEKKILKSTSEEESIGRREENESKLDSIQPATTEEAKNEKFVLNPVHEESKNRKENESNDSRLNSEIDSDTKKIENKVGEKRKVESSNENEAVEEKEEPSFKHVKKDHSSAKVNEDTNEGI